MIKYFFDLDLEKNAKDNHQDPESKDEIE